MISLLTIGLLTIGPQTTVWANSPDQNPIEKITIDADRMLLNMETGESIYTGNVRITQGELVLTGDKVTLQQSNNELESLTVIGKPARYSHVTKKGEPIKAQSEHLVYIANQNKLVMTTNASLQQSEQQVSSQLITYDTLKGIIIAGDNNAASNLSGSGKPQRVNITLTPKKSILPTKPSSPAATSPTQASGKK